MNHLLFSLCVCICLLSRMRALPLFVIDESTSREFAVEVESPTATVADLVHEVARYKGVNPRHIVLSFQGTRLTDLDQPLADTGLSSECRLSLAFDPIIELKWNECGSQHYKLNDSDVLQWDIGQDITQFGWLPEMDRVFVEFWDHNGVRGYTKLIEYRFYDAPVTSHAFVIVCVAAEQHGIDEIPEEMYVAAEHLELEQYAKDLLVAPAHGGDMRLSYNRHRRVGVYQFPAGYGLLLRYKNETQSIV